MLGDRRNHAQVGIASTEVENQEAREFGGVGDVPLRNR
jgi:hypothetical protein